MRSLAIVVLAVGCADVPDSDIDGDGIADDADDCIAGFRDETVDADGDHKDASIDLCPHDDSGVAGDVDLDGIPDACDLFPADMARPDTRRCVTSFSVRWMNASYLVGRAGEAEWNLGGPLTATPSETVSIFSSFEKQYKSTTYELQAHVTVGAGASFLLFARADPDQISNQDVACGIDDQNLFVWDNNGKHALVPLPGVPDVIRLSATINPTAVLCRITIGKQSMATTYAVTAPRGLFGFRSQGAKVTIDSVVVDSRETPPPI